MPIEKIIILEDIGEVSLKRSRRFKRLSIRMAPNKGIWINLPFGISYKEGIEFANKNKAWILKNKIKKEQKENSCTVFSINCDFKTKFHSLKLMARETNFFSTELDSGFLKVFYPESLEVENDQLQNFIRNSIIETLRCEANYYLPNRITYLAKKHGFSYHSLKVKNTRSRWGSCSHDNKINLSLHLMRLSEELSDMVILHELCHTIVKNHSSDFWNLLSKHCNNLSSKRKQLKDYSTQII
ncbi:M48 family metallopeptidase [Ancylomarina longa]|uniref:M48 family peptidase n=1 Tax=Ancylomarina longa TaxID=2487017 RepID=A0A434AYT1_9BACT|nr:SprT family zinc-dependent metalloprotease [Ancylomarina longa]RUT79778.1 M48 family peptidase [Ancylomarina longa]